MQSKSTTVRIRATDKRRLDDLCRLSHRGITDMLAYLIDKEQQAIGAPRRRKKAS